MNRPAVFLDRDGTLIEDVGYLDDPEKIRLLPGVADALCRFAEAGLLCIVISNQSGVARGRFNEETMWAVHAGVEAALANDGAAVHAAYYCPHFPGPEAVVADYRVECDCRKPAPGMLIRAARDHEVDLSRSWMVGDSLRDIEAGRRAGCRVILLDRSSTPDGAGGRADHVVRSLSESVAIVIGAMKQNAQTSGRPDRAPDASHLADEGAIPLLKAIRDELERANRARRQNDFSLLRLFAALAQMFAVAAAILGLVALANDHDPGASSRFALACFLQLAAATAFLLDRFR